MSTIGTSGSGTDSSGQTRTGLQSAIHNYCQYLEVVAKDVKLIYDPATHELVQIVGSVNTAL